MKKHNLFKVVGIAILVTVLLTWLLPITYYQYDIVTGARSQVGLFDLFKYPSESLKYFGDIALYILAIGGFYGVLHKINAYQNLIDNISKKMIGKESIILIVIMALLAIFTSVCGASMGLLIIVPFIVSLVLAMGYDKITAALVTVGSISVGLLGTTISSTYISDGYNTTIQNGMGVVNAILSTKATSQIIAKIVLLVIGLVLLIVNTLLHIKKNPKSDAALLKGKEAKKENSKNNDQCSKTWPIVLIVDLIFVVSMLSLMSWTSVLKVNWFSKATNAVLSAKIFKFPIFGKILGTVPAFENWTLTEIGILLLIGSFILSIIYKVKFNEYIESIVVGARKALKPAVLTVLIYVVLVIVSYNPITLTITKPLLKLGTGLNVFTMSLVSIIASVFNVDLGYAASSVLPYATQLITDTKLYPTIALIWQATYGFVTLVAPTSVILISILSYLDIPYGKWLKSNWKLILEILALCLLTFTVLILI